MSPTFKRFSKFQSLTVLAAGFLSLLSVTYALGEPAEYKVLYNFCSAANCADGARPHSKLVFDKAGNLYGTTAGGGNNGLGVVFELSSSGGVWGETVLYSFCVGGVRNCPDGANPMAGLTIDAGGNLYGTTSAGGTFGIGTVFELSPSSHPGGSWTETVLWSFGTTGDGKNPLSHLYLDTSGDLYGTTSGGGAYAGGTVFRLVSQAGSQWTEDILFSFGSDPYNGFDPEAGVAPDKLGNLCGTTKLGGAKINDGWGVAYKLSPTDQLPWTETVLYRFSKKVGAYPVSTLNFDGFGNLYGTLSEWGAGFSGALFRLTPQGRQHNLPFFGMPDAGSPNAGVLVQGNSLYGTTTAGGAQNGGSIFKVHGTTESVVYSFCSQANCTDGSQPYAALILRGKSLFGTTAGGGANHQGGVVFQISESAPVFPKVASKKSPTAPKIHLAAAGLR